jgi:O-antigen ligase
VPYQDAQRLLTRLILPFLVLVTVAVSPTVSVDPINVPKLLILVTFGGVCLGILALNFRSISSSPIGRTVPIFLGGFFIFGLLFSFLDSELDWKEQFFGAMGRNTGFITYLSLVLIFLCLITFFSSDLLSKSIIALVLSGLASSIYGFLQFLDLDPVGWSNAYNPVIGFLGNPNFQSSFIGIANIGLVHFLIYSKLSISRRGALLLAVLLGVFVIYASDSQQGILVFLLGVSLLVMGRLYQFENKIYSRGFSLLVLIAGLVATLGILQRGPLSSILYKPSVTYRGDYWRAGYRMFKENLLNGLGLDSYGNYYRQYRDIEAVLRRGPEITSNTAHNVFIDLASNGGMALLLPYVLLISYTCWIFSRAIKVPSSKRPQLVLVFSLWVCYQVQSMISINQIALAAWGWVLMGLIIGQSVQFLHGKDEISMKSRKTNYASPPRAIGASTILASSLFGVLGFCIGVLPLSASASERSALRSGMAEKVVEAAFRNPRDPGRMNSSAVALSNNGLSEEAQKIALATVNEFPTSFGAWRLITQLELTTEQDKREAYAKMQELDPLNPNLK